MTRTTTIVVPCNSTVIGYGGAETQAATCKELSNTGLGLGFWVMLAFALVALGWLVRHLSKARP